MTSEHISDGRKEIIDAYLNFLKAHQKLPTYSDLHKLNIPKSKIKHHFVNIGNLHEEIVNNYSNVINKHIAHESYIFSEKKLEQLNEDLKKFKRFIVTTAISGKAVDGNFLAALKNYSKRRKAKRLILPAQDRANRSRRTGVRYNWTFSHQLKEEAFVHKDTELNTNLFLSSILLSAKHINPTTGLSRIGQRHGSYIFASPKQNLEYVNGSFNHKKYPHAIITTGCITVANYESDRYMSDRTSYIAETDHVIGAVIVEIVNDSIYHFRQIQADASGAFIDLGIKYNPDGTTEDIKTDIVLGDWHAGATDPLIKDTTSEIIKSLSIEDIYIHDVFDGKSINPHEEHKHATRARLVGGNRHLLEDEIENCAKDINWFLKQTDGNIYIVKSNHDEFLDRYIESGRYVKEPINYDIGHDLAPVVKRREDPLKWSCEHYHGIDAMDRVVWFQRSSDHTIGGVQMAAHGDRGTNGTRGSMLSIEKVFGIAVIGHNHSAAIMRGIYRVGTSTYLDLDYNDYQMSNWTHTHCLIYPNGSRQLINIIKTSDEEAEWCL